MGAEHAGKGSDIQLGPVAGPLGRSPEGGRNWEGFSPDPVLTGVMTAESVKGIQSAGVMACTKHFIMNEQEHFRQGPQSPFNNTEAYSSNIDDATMHETYLWPFADAVRAGTASVMCSYNRINNSYAAANSATLNGLLKAELGFQGFLMSDWSAQHSGVSAILAGMDMTMPGDVSFYSGDSYFGANLTIAVLNGTVPQWRLDDAVVRIVAAWYYVGRDSAQVPINFDSWTSDTYGFQNFFAEEGYGLINEHVDVRGEHANTIRQVGSASTVLLKNVNNALPLTGREKLTAVIGEDAGPNMYGPNGCDDRGCDNGTLAMGWGSGTAQFPYLITPDAAIQSQVVGQGGAYESVFDNYASKQIATLAGRASVAMVFVNADSGEGYINVDNNVGDRNNLTLWHDGDLLIKNVSALNNNTVVVVHSSGPVILEDIKNNENVTAIIWAGLPGEQSGNSLADVIYGRVNPGGKLPFTLGAKREDYGSDLLYVPNADEPQIQFSEGNFVDYRAFDKANITPTYEFGYGMSYTTFKYSSITVAQYSKSNYTATTGLTPPAPKFGTISNVTSDYLFPSNFSKVEDYIYPYLNSTDLKASSGDADYGIGGATPPGSQDGSPQRRLPASGPSGGNPGLYDVIYTVSSTITNTGSIPGEEVAQLYVSLGGPYDPVKVLRGFDRISIEPGASATFTVDLTRRDLSNWDTGKQNWYISNYTKIAYVGSSSRNLPLQIQLM